MLHFMRLGRRALGLGEFLVNDERLAIDSGRLLDLDIGVPESRLLPGDAATLPFVMMGLYVHHAWRARLHVLRLEHLLLKVLRVAQLVLLDRNPEPVVIIMTHGHGVWLVARGHHDRLTAILVVALRAMGA